MIYKIIRVLHRFTVWVTGWIRVGVMWFFKHDNRVKGVRNMRKMLAVMELASRLTTNKTDDLVITTLKNRIDSVIRELPEELRIEAIKNVNLKDKGPAKEVHIGYDEKKGLSGGLSFKF